MTHVAATRFGRALPDGGTIGIVAPSGPHFNRSDVLRGVEWWETQGFRVKLAPRVWAQDDYVAGTPEARARDLEAMFADPEVDAIQCLRGGTGAAQILPHLDLGVVADNPKAFVGYSDITALHVAIRQKTGLATVHGPSLQSMGAPDRTAFTWDSLLAFLRGGTTGEVPPDPDDPYVVRVHGGRATAPIVGGNLFTLHHLIGTPWDVRLDGAIFFFEEIDEPAYKIEAMLWQLRAAGKLDRVAGIVVGELKDCDWSPERARQPRTRSIEDVLRLMLEPLGVPVLYRLPLGHGRHLATLPLGVAATLDAEARSLTIDEPALAGGEPEPRRAPAS